MVSNKLARHFRNSLFDNPEINNFFDTVRPMLLNPNIDLYTLFETSANKAHTSSFDDGQILIWTRGDYPKIRITKEEDEDRNLLGVKILAAVPGVTKEELKVEIGSSSIGILINRNDEPYKEDLKAGRVLINELPGGRKEFYIDFSGPIDLQSAKASLKDNGLLEIYVPAKIPKKINILE